MTTHAVGTHDEWLAARRELLEREKELTEGAAAAGVSGGSS